MRNDPRLLSNDRPVGYLRVVRYYPLTDALVMASAS